MITNKDLLEHFGLDESEVLEHYGRKGMKWGQRIYSGSKSLTKKVGRKIKNKIATKYNGYKEKRSRRTNLLSNRQAKKESRQHILDVQKAYRDMGKLSDTDVARLAKRLENEVKIQQNAQKLAATLPPSKRKVFLKGMKKLGDTPFPQPQFDKSGRLVAFSPDGTIKSMITKTAVKAGTAYLNRKLSERSIDPEAVENVYKAFDKAKDIVNKAKAVKDDMDNVIEVPDGEMTRIKRDTGNRFRDTYHFYPNKQSSIYEPPKRKLLN